MVISRSVAIGFASAGLTVATGGLGLGTWWMVRKTAQVLTPPSTPVKGAPAAAPWRHHTDSMGFAVDLPRDWILKGDPATGQVAMAGTEGERLVVWPLFMEADPGRRAGPLLARIAGKLWPEAVWGAPEAAGPAVWRLRGGAGTARGVCLLACRPTPRGTAAIAYLWRAPSPTTPQAEDRLARILESFRLQGRPEEAPARPVVQHTRWTDPREGAFSLELPSGWRVSGGAQRPSTLLVQSEVQATSEDGALTLTLGDAFPIYVEPSPLLAFGGIQAGGTYPDATGYRHPVAPYTPGAAYAVQAILPRRVGAFRILKQAPRPELARQLVSLGMNHFDAGEVEYAFQRGGQAFRGWLLCITERVAAPQVMNWHVWRLCLAEAPEARFGEAGAALQHAVSTFRIDPAWAEGQARLTAAQSGIITQMGEATSRAILETGRFRSETLDAIHHRGALARRGVEEVVDPQTGEKRTVSSGSNYYWVDPRGTVLGTDTDTRPNLDFRALTRVQ